jgi:hypothetical protein
MNTKTHMRKRVRGGKGGAIAPVWLCWLAVCLPACHTETKWSPARPDGEPHAYVKSTFGQNMWREGEAARPKKTKTVFLSAMQLPY